MDGMNGHEHVVVIGETNQPDGVNSALRRPGCFDREFYSALPDLEARGKILSIVTRKWEGVAVIRRGKVGRERERERG